MARPSKSLLELVRDGTFRARRHHELLAQPDLPWKTLSHLQQRYRDAGLEFERRRVAVEFENAIPLLHAKQERSRKDLPEILDSLGPPRSAERVLNLAPRFFRHYAGPRAGKPFRFEPFQSDYVREFWRRRRNGRRVYRFGLFGIPKGNGKTPLAAVLGTSALMDPPAGDLPEVYGIAGDRKQAGFAQKFVKKSIDTTDLGNWLKQSGNTISCPSTNGTYELLSSEGFNAHGINPSAGLVDEWWQFKHPHQREGVNALEDALQKRGGESWLQAISQAYFDFDTMLAETHQAALKHPKLRVERDGCLLILEDEESGFLMHWYGAPDDADIEDPKIIRGCNPLSVLSVEDIIAPLKRPGANESAWRRLHANQPTRGAKSWLATGVWARLLADVRIPVGADVYLAIDAARKGDTTAVGLAWRDPDGRIHVRAYVWSAIATNKAHKYVDGGVLVNEELVEPYIHELAKKHRVRGIVFDEQYFVTEAHHLGRAGFRIAPMYPWSKEMTDAVVLFKKLVDTGGIAHNGDEVLAAHIGNVVGEPRLRGTDEIEKIGKPGREFRIDAATAVVMATWLCVNSPAGGFSGGVEVARDAKEKS